MYEQKLKTILIYEEHLRTIRIKMLLYSSYVTTRVLTGQSVEFLVRFFTLDIVIVRADVRGPWAMGRTSLIDGVPPTYILRPPDTILRGTLYVTASLVTFYYKNNRPNKFLVTTTFHRFCNINYRTHGIFTPE